MLKIFVLNKLDKNFIDVLDRVIKDPYEVVEVDPVVIATKGMEPYTKSSGACYLTILSPVLDEEKVIDSEDFQKLKADTVFMTALDIIKRNSLLTVTFGIFSNLISEVYGFCNYERVTTINSPSSKSVSIRKSNDEFVTYTTMGRSNLLMGLANNNVSSDIEVIGWNTYYSSSKYKLLPTGEITEGHKSYIEPEIVKYNHRSTLCFQSHWEDSQARSVYSVLYSFFKHKI